MLNIKHFREQIIRPVLVRLDMHSEAAENLVLGTAIHESNLTHLVQLGGGPALGFYQMEPATEWDLIKNYIRYKPKLHKLMMGFPRYAEIFAAIEESEKT